MTDLSREAKQDRNGVKELALLPIIIRKPQSEKEEKYLREILKYQFNNLEEPGMMIQFPYGAGKNRKNFKFFHGGEYHLPRFIAEWVESRSTPMWGFKPDGSGRMVKNRLGDKQRFQMRPIYSDSRFEDEVPKKAA